MDDRRGGPLGGARCGVVEGMQVKEWEPEGCVRPHSLLVPWLQDRAGPHFLSKKLRHVVCQSSFYFLDVRIYLYEKSYQGINILGLCTCCRLSWNVPPLLLYVCLVNSSHTSRHLLQEAFSDQCPLPNSGVITLPSHEGHLPFSCQSFFHPIWRGFCRAGDCLVLYQVPNTPQGSVNVRCMDEAWMTHGCLVIPGGTWVPTWVSTVFSAGSVLPAPNH